MDAITLLIIGIELLNTCIIVATTGIECILVGIFAIYQIYQARKLDKAVATVRRMIKDPRTYATFVDLLGDALKGKLKGEVNKAKKEAMTQGGGILGQVGEMFKGMSAKGGEYVPPTSKPSAKTKAKSDIKPEDIPDDVARASEQAMKLGQWMKDNLTPEQKKALDKEMTA